MRKIYRESFGYFLSSLPVLLIFAFIIEALPWVLQPRSEALISVVALTIIAYYFHRHFLFEEKLALRNAPIAKGAPPLKFGWFLSVTAALILVPVAATFIVVLQYSDMPAPGLIVIMFFLAYFLTLCLFGTALPAAVARDGTFRLSQGLRAGFQTMWRLVAGPGLVGAVLFAVILASTLGLQAAGVPEDSLIMLGLFMLMRTLGFLPTIFAVAVLCEMYRKTRPAPRLGQGAEGSDHTPA